VFSSQRTGAATAISRDDLALLPTISGRINDITRLTPQARGNSYSGQDDRQNNITVDGSYFNNAFGLGDGQPGGRTNVAPISLESIEQVQVSVAPYDVRQGNFIGATVNTVTRSGTNQLSASVYTRYRNQDFVGTEAQGLAVNPGTFTFRNTGVNAGGPIVKNRLFVFGNYENEKDTRPLHTFVANTGGQPVGGSVNPRAGLRPGCAERVSEAELQVRHRPVPEYSGRNAGQALSVEDRLQPQHQQQDQFPL
jgi:hypothetical protein